MKKEYSSIEELIEKNLSTEEPGSTLELINDLKIVKERGYFTKDEFLKMAMWKSPRPKKWYLANSEETIEEISRKVFATNCEKRRMELLTQLRGVSIPAASAILMLTDPENYGVIDIRVWQILYLYGSVSAKPTGRNFNFNNWYDYLMKLRELADKFGVKVRDIERTLFLYHVRIRQGRLYD